ncbi:MAG: tetratricopeptide repeat protein [Phycisphaerae bacterium]
MAKKRIFGLDPKKLDKLLSIGTEGFDIEDKKPPMTDEDTPAEKIDGPKATASLGIFTEQPGGQIGRYKLLSVLGEGGMGIVYLAEQKQPIRRQAALKVIKPGMDSKRVIARFEAERQALALLDHPNIAHVYDAGTTESGRPYFVMEYVKGLSVTEHCDRHKLTIEERLKVFLQVCHAVHHAHQKGIIHRDIKPSNILISILDDEAVPKIIDFGVAKALAQPLTERTLVTEQGQLFGTPEYMSPEQADMASEDIDTRSDIYSLGVLLYVLLTGVLPFDSETLREGGIEHIRQVIRETDPKTPSTRLSSLGEEAKKVAQSRRTEIATLAKKLHKELEWIPLKAMRKERSERYRSASEFADDIENYLKGAPLIAGPPGTIYRLKKSVWRHKALVAGTLAVLVVSVIGAVVSLIFALGQARALAENQIITDFLENDVLSSVRTAKIGEATVSYVLDAASKKLEGKFKDRPLIEASIQEKLGGTYRTIGEPEKAEQHWLRAIEIYQQRYGEEHPTTQRMMSSLGWIYEDQGRYYDMEHVWTKYLKFRQRISGVELQPDLMNALGATYWHLGKYREAESLFEKILQLVPSELGGENVWLLPWFRCNLARVYAAQGRYEEAERLFVETLKTTEWPEEHISAKFVYTSALADTYREQGSYDKAEALFDKTLETMRQRLGNKHLRTLKCVYGFVRLYIDQDRYDESKTLFNEALPIVRERLRKEHPLTLRFVNAYAVLHTKQKQYDQAETLFDEALKGRQRELGDDHPDTLETKNDLAVLYKEQARYDEAESLLLETLEGRRKVLGEEHPDTLVSLNHLIELYEVWNKPEKAEQWRAKLPDAEPAK